jgi:fatty-acyl-CoA synthase
MRAIDYFDKGAEASSERIAVVDGDARYSYRETRIITERIARAMQAGRVEGQACAGIYSHNHAAVLFAMLGIMRAGLAWVPINYRNAMDANVEYMNYVEMAWLF